MPRLREWRWDAWARWTRDQVWKDGPAILAFDTETSGVEFYDLPFSGQVTWRRPDGALQSGYFDLDDERRVRLLRDTLTSVPTLVAHNWKFDAQKALLIGALTWEDIGHLEIHDTQTMYTLLDENGRKGLKHLAVTVLGYDDTIEVEVKSGPNKGTMKRVPKEQHRLNEVRRRLKLRKEDGYHLLPREVLIPYALRDTEFTLRLFETLWPRLQKKDEELQKLYVQSIQLKRVLLRMEADGFLLDVPYLEDTTSEYGARVMESWQRIIELTGNDELNPQSPAQLLDAFAARGHRLESTDVDTLATLDDDLARAVLEYREVKKLHSTYLSGLLSSQRDGLVHPNFNDDGARTGRMSSGAAKE